MSHTIKHQLISTSIVLSGYGTAHV